MSWTSEALEALDQRAVSGHPTLELDNARVIYLCANCERMRTVLFLTEDRWLCTNCRNEGDARPTFIPVSSNHKE